jgi:DNA-binding NtrC family response regulator
MAQILVVDDDLGMREWFTEVLEGAGHQVVTAQDGVEARSLAGRTAPEILITDVSMPNEEGIGLLMAMRRSHPALKIVVISGKDPETLLDAKLLGANVTLRKPVDMSTVLQCVRGLAAGKC